MKKTINAMELWGRIDELINDRKSFLTNDAEENKIWLHDIETLEYAKLFIGAVERTKKHVKKLSSVGRGCEIYADIKREILKQLEVTNENN